MATQETKVCIACNKKLPINNFWKDKNSKTGSVARCKECVNSGKTNNPHFSNKSQTTKIDPKIATADVSVDFLADYRKTRKTEWQLSQVKLLMIKIKEAVGNGIEYFDKIFAIHGSGHHKQGCAAMLAEMKKLALYNREQKSKNKPEESLDDYWRNGRRFKLGNQIVAAPKSNGKK